MDNRTRTLFKSLTYIFIILLVFRIVSNINLGLFPLTRIFVHVFIIVILSLRDKVTWTLGIIFFSCCLIYYLFISAGITYPSEVEFTLPIVELFFGDKHGFSNAEPIVWLLLWMPLPFYLGITAWFLTKKIRNLYSSVDILKWS